MSTKTSPENSSDREIVISRTFEAPRELVWEAMTNPKHVVNWWGPRGFSTTIEHMDVRPGGSWKHTMRGPDGTNYPNKSVFKEVVKPERIVYSHGGGREDGPGASFVATWLFEAVSETKTQVTIRMVFPTTEARDFVIKEFGAVEGGKQTLMRLSEHLAAAQSRPFIITREFDAPRDLVWKAWTEPERFLQWFGPKGATTTIRKMDFQPGGMLHYSQRMPDGRELWGKAAYREIVPPVKIVWVNSFSDKDEGTARHPLTTELWPLFLLTEVTFSERNGKTSVTIKWLPLDATEEERKVFDSRLDSMNQGWGGTLDQLTAYLAKTKS